MKYYFFLSLWLISLSISCTKEQCEDKELPTFSLEEEYNCVNTKYQLNVDLNNQFRIIRSQTEFDNLVSGSCAPTIDFDTYDLIVGKQGLSSGNISIDYLLQDFCDEKSLKLLVTFNQNVTTEAPNLTYHALILKLGDEETVEITIEEKYE